MADMNNLSWDELSQIRGALSPQYQSLVAPYEHQAYAREMVQENPFNAAWLTPFVPGYALAKYFNLLPVDEKTTKPSWEQISHGWNGISQGLGGGIGGRIMGALSR
jgi:hypothetical protein